jgi:hypothetical protein
LVYEPQNKDHQEALSQALKRGLEDPELQPLGQAMFDVLGHDDA